MTDQEKISGKDVAWLFAYSMLIGLLLVAFTSFPTFWRFVFSLGAVFIGFKFFGKYERLALRIWLCVLSFFFFFLFTVITVMILYMTGNLTVQDAA